MLLVRISENYSNGKWKTLKSVMNFLWKKFYLKKSAYSKIPLKSKIGILTLTRIIMKKEVCRCNS